MRNNLLVVWPELVLCCKTVCMHRSFEKGYSHTVTQIHLWSVVKRLSAGSIINDWCLSIHRNLWVSRSSSIINCTEEKHTELFARNKITSINMWLNPVTTQTSGIFDWMQLKLVYRILKSLRVVISLEKFLSYSSCEIGDRGFHSLATMCKGFFFW